jgi:LCP family protein required for cell wall assembly
MSDEWIPPASASRSRSRVRNRPVPTRHGRLPSVGPVSTLLKFLGMGIAVLLVSTLGVAAYAVVDTVSRIPQGIHLAKLPGHTGDPVPDIGSIEGGVNLLLTGTDTRTGQGAAFGSKEDLAASSGEGNNDVTMVLHISEDHTNATVISIPRDLLVSIPACPKPNGGSYPASSNQMFNTTLYRGGLSCVVLTAEKLLGIEIPFAAQISFDGVIGMSNAIGGVPVCLATPLKDKYVGLDLAAGEHTLVGAETLAFVRSRHGVGDGSDLGRISNQQLFMSSLMRKATSSGVLSNPLALYGLAKAAVSNMQLSDTLTNPSTLVSIALAMKSIGLDKVVFLQFPSRSDPAFPNRVVPDAQAAKILTTALAADQPVQLTGKVGRAAVLDPATPAAPTTPTTPSSTPVTPSTGASGTPEPTTSSVALPPSVTGQTADQQTCTKGN